MKSKAGGVGNFLEALLQLIEVNSGKSIDQSIADKTLAGDVKSAHERFKKDCANMNYGHTGRPDPVRDFATWFAAKPEDHHDDCSCIDCELASWAGHIPEDSQTLQDPTATFLVAGHKTTSAAYLLKQLRDAVAAGRTFSNPKKGD